MKIKNFILSTALIILVSFPVHADVVWPSLYISKGMLSIKVILLGLFIELFFVKYFTKVSWKKASIVTFLMNLITTLLGIIFIILIFSLKTDVPIIVPRVITPKFIAAKISVGLLVYAW